MVLTFDDVTRYVSRFEQLVKDPRKRCLRQLEIAKLYREANCFEQAVECAREYLKVNPKDHRAYNLLGAVSEELEQWNDALKYYKRSIEILRHQKEILIKIVEVYSRVCHDEPDVAKVWADKAETIMPSHPAVFNLKWNLLAYGGAGNFEEMEDLLAQELVRRPRDANLHVKLLELYLDKGDLEEAYTHCKSLLTSKVFQYNKDWLVCSADVFKQFHRNSHDSDGSVKSLMYYVFTLCCLMDVLLKTSAFVNARDIFLRLDEAGSKVYLLETSALSSDLQNEFEVFRTEIRGQIYFFLALLIYKMAQQDDVAWSYAARLATPCFAVSSSVEIPDKKAGWLQRKPLPENQKVIWYEMACLRRSQTDHMLLMIEREISKEWIQTRVSDICSTPGRVELIEQVYGKRESGQKSLLMMDKEFLGTEYKTPDLESMETCDLVSVSSNPGNFDILIWIGIVCHLNRSPKFEAFKIASEQFFGINFDVSDLRNCSPFTLSTIDLEVFIEAVVYSCVDRLLNECKKDEYEPTFLPLAVTTPLCTNAQSDLWDAAFRLHTGKTWQANTSKLKSILQRGLETLRVIGCHGINPVILKHISKIFLAKADEIQNDRENEWTDQLAFESYRRRGFHYGDEALKLLEIIEGGRELGRPKAPLIPPLLKGSNENETADMIESLRMTLADAAFRSDDCTDALGYLNGLFTADAAYKQAQIYRDLASRENHTNIEGLRSHLSFLRKSRDMLQICLQRLDKSQVELCEKIQSEIDEIKEAITEQSGISSAPNKVLDFPYSPDDPEEERVIFRENGSFQDDNTIEAKLALENSILHEQLAVRNHEFSVLASRIHKLEREMSEMRANQSSNDSIVKPRQNSCVATDESSSSAVYVPKDDLTSGSGNLTPRLEPEMSWDPFSPAPVFPVGFFSGLVDTIEKLDEETEAEVLAANNSSPVSLPTKSKTPDTSVREENSSRGNDDDASFGDTLHIEPLVSLTRKSDLTTGEENEETVFMERAKLYRFHEGQWKERGVGDIKILLDRKSSKSRILMRREKVLKICANHLLTDDMNLTKKTESLNTYVWCTPADLSDAEPKAETFAIRFKVEETGKEFSKAFLKYKNITCSEDRPNEEMKSSLENEGKKSASGKDGKEEQNAVDGTVSFDFTKFSQQPAGDSVKFDETKSSFQSRGNGVSQKEGTKSEVNTTGVPIQNEAAKLDFKSPSTSAGFVFDPSKFKFEFGAQKSDAANNSQNLSAARNPFLAAAQSSASSKTLPFSFGRLEVGKSFGSLSPFGSEQAPTQVSTPFASNLVQRPYVALAESTPNSEISVLPVSGTNTGTQLLGQDYQSNDYLSVTTQGQSFINNQMTDQGQYFQSDWESMQDRYYDAVYDENGALYDENSFYQNDDFHNDGEYYTAEDVYYGDEDAYYANSEQGFEYYDQDLPRDVPPADSDANSDRMSQPEAAATSEEVVPHVVQMIDDDIFVTFVKKASFALRAKASRLLLPPNFYATSSHPACSGCHGCGMEVSNSAAIAPDNEQPQLSSIENLGTAEQKPAIFGATASGTQGGSGQEFFSFADLVKSQSKGIFTGQVTTTPKAFSGAGSMLFVAKEAQEENDFDPTFKPIVELKKKEDLKTGEEGYVDLFKNRAKLFRFDFDAKQWKERGVGDMRLSYNPDTSYCRVIMRRDTVLKLCANHPVMPDIELKPHGMSSTSWLWVSGADYSEGEPQMQQFAVRFKSKEIADEFKNVFQDCQKRIIKYLDELDQKKSADSGAAVEGQPSRAYVDSQIRHNFSMEDLVVTYVKEPDIVEANRASMLMLPRTFFTASSIPPCSGCSGCLVISRQEGHDITDGSVILKEQTERKENKSTFLSFAGLASSSTVEPVAFQSTGKGFVGAGTALFTSPKQNEDPNTFDPTFKPIVELKRKDDLKTGEEGYVDLFKNRAKLFRFDFDAKQWKERGVGDMRLSYNPDTSYCRVIMRRDTVLKLCANHPVMPDIELKPHGMSSTSWLWVSGADYSEGEPQMQQFAVRFKSKEIADEFMGVFKKCQKIIEIYLNANNLPAAQLPTDYGKVQAVKEEKYREKVAQDEAKPDKKATSTAKVSSDDKSIVLNNGMFGSSKGDNGLGLGQSPDSPVTFAESFANVIADPQAANEAVSVASSASWTVDSGIFSVPVLNSGSAAMMSPFGSVLFGGQYESNEGQPTDDDQRLAMTQAQSGSKDHDVDYWLCEECSVENIIENETCIGCNAAKGILETTGQSKSHQSQKDKPFGLFKVKEGSWECPACMLQNDKDKKTCVSCGSDCPGAKATVPKPASPPQESSTCKTFGMFKVKKGSWECPTCMLQNDEGKEKCISCGSDSPRVQATAKKPVSSVQEIPTNKSFGMFKVKEGSWECPTCMLQNDRSKEKCISCSSDSPHAQTTAQKPASSVQESSTSKAFGTSASNLGTNPDSPTASSVGPNISSIVFGNQTSISFQTTPQSAPFPMPSFSMPLFKFGSTVNQESTAATQQSSDSLTWKAAADKSGGVADKPSLFGTQFVTSNQQKDSTPNNFWSSAETPIKPGDSIFGKPKQENQNEGKSLLSQPAANAFEMPKTGNGPLRDNASTPSTYVVTPRSPESPCKEDGGGIQCSPLVNLERLDNPKTGEEDEIVVFCEKAKLYRYDAVGKEWKERGVGELKILQRRDALNKYRLIMRRDQIRKVCANHFLVPGMDLVGMPNSEKMKIWTASADFADEEAKKETFAARFRSLEIVEKFESAFVRATSGEKTKEEYRSEQKSSGNKLDDTLEGEFIGDADKNEDGATVGNSGVKDIDLRVTEVLLPSTEDQNKAEKLLLPKEFFNTPSSGSIDVTSDKADVTFRTPGQAKDRPTEVFVTPKSSLFTTGDLAAPVQEPKSPEKFSEDCSASFSPIVQLEKVKVETGEESEVTLFCDKAKLYRYDDEGRQWKERGVGDLKILKNVKTQSARMIMRRDQVKKICLNHSIVSGMNLEFMAKRTNTLIWFTHADFADEEARAEKFAARFKSEEIMKKFKDCFDDILRDGSSLDSPKKNEGLVNDRSGVEDLELKPAVTQKQETEKQEEIEERMEGDPLNGNSKTKESSSTIQSFGPSLVQAIASTAISSQEVTSTPVFSFATSAASESDKVESKSKFSWSAPGTQKLFSIGTLSVGSNTTTEVQSHVRANSPTDKQNFGFFSFDWSKTTSSKGPFSFTSFASKTVEDVPFDVNDTGDREQVPRFNWSGLGQKKEVTVSDADLLKEDTSKYDEGKSPDCTHSPGKLEEIVPGKLEEAKSPDCTHSPGKLEETYDPSEAIVSLERVESSTGEECEDVTFVAWAKAYRFDSESKQWKERGVGDVKILRHKSTGQYRLLMRRAQVKKIAINHVLTKDMKLEANRTAKNSWIWFTNADFSDEVSKPEKFTIRFKNEDASTRFKGVFDDAVKKLNDGPKPEMMSEGVCHRESLTKSKESTTEENIETDLMSAAADELHITYVKQPTNEEREHADRLLLPSGFFAPFSEIPKRKNIQTKSEVSLVVKQPDDSHGKMAFSMIGDGLSFADLVSQPTGTFSGFGSSPDKQNGFKGQGSVLFGKREEGSSQCADGEDFLSFKPIVSLTVTETKTGEEEEEVMFAERCKLYRLDKNSNQWKERGVGDMKILFHGQQHTFRVIMRRDVVFKLGANHLILPGMQLKPKEGRETTWVWKTNADISDEEPREETFTVKFKTAEIGRRFAEVFENCMTKAEEEGVREEKVEENRKSPSYSSFERLSTTSTENPVLELDPSSKALVVNEAECSKQLTPTQGDSLQPAADDQRDPSAKLGGDKNLPAEIEENGKAAVSTFGSRFSGLDFSALAKSDSGAFQTSSKGEFVNAGAMLFAQGTKDAEGQNPRLEAIVQLEQVQAKSGEEDEDVIFESKVKLFRFSSETKEWKERGVGAMRLLHNKEKNTRRLVMRRDVVFKIAANHALTKGMKLDVMKSSPRTLTWKALSDVSDDEPVDAMFAAKFKSEDVMREFSHAFEAMCSGEEMELRGDNAKKDGNEKEAAMAQCCSPGIREELQDYLDDKAGASSS